MFPITGTFLVRYQPLVLFLYSRQSYGLVERISYLEVNDDCCEEGVAVSSERAPPKEVCL